MTGNIERKLSFELGSSEFKIMNEKVLHLDNRVEFKFEYNGLGKVLVRYDDGEITGKARWKPIKNKLKNGKKPTTKYSGVYEWAKYSEEKGYYWGK